MTFSIIIPCYNTAPYLKRCIESILNQTYKDWEMILVNDGSTDNTMEIIHTYAEKDRRIKVFDQENQGVSASRNRGIKEARGDYILFADSDDWYQNEKSLEQIVKTSDNLSAEIVVFQFNQVMTDGRHRYKTNNLQYFSRKRCKYAGEDFFLNVLNREEIYEWFPWIYAFKREFWIKSQVEFNTQIHYYEDADIIYRVILKAKKIAILQEPIYMYLVDREGQATQTSRQLLESALSVCKNNIDTVNRIKIDSKVRNLLNGNFCHTYFMSLILINYLKKKDRKEIFTFLNNNRYIMDYASNKRDRLLKKIIAIFGLHITAKLLFVRSKKKKWSKK